MRQRTLLLLAAAAPLCRAHQPAFSIHDDLLAYPQYEVIFAPDIVTEPEAQALLDRGAFDDAPVAYELMRLAPTARYLCAIPLQDSTVDNSTSTTAAGELAHELAQASARGWDLVGDMRTGPCLFFMSGWWSYRFCYGREVVQFHALPALPNGSPPVRDQSAAEYLLGRASPRVATPFFPPPPPTPPAAQLPDGQRLQRKGDERFLVQRLDGGTPCDLTGRDRTIDIQYHCSLGAKTDRIDSVKEVTTCTYLMVIYTPRLCADLAFLPPREAVANPINCRLIAASASSSSSPSTHNPHGDTNSEASVHAAQALQWQSPAAAAGADGNAVPEAKPVTIGGIVVGGRKVVGAGGRGLGVLRSSHQGASPLQQQLHAIGRFDLRVSGGGHAAPGEQPAPAGAADTAGVPQVLARAESRADGGQLEAMTVDELERLDMDPAKVQALQRQLQELAGDHGWTLELLELPNDRGFEMRGVVDVDLALDPRVLAAMPDSPQQQQQPDADPEQDGDGRPKQPPELEPGAEARTSPVP